MGREQRRTRRRRAGGILAAVATAAVTAAAAAPAAGASVPVRFERIAGYDAPGTPEAARQGRDPEDRAREGARNVLVLNPGTSASAAYFEPLAEDDRRSAAPGLAGVGGRAPREPARGPVGARPRQGRQGHAAAGLRLLPRLAHRPEHHRRTSSSSRTRRSPTPSSGACRREIEDLRRVVHEAAAPAGAGSSSAATRSAARSPPPTRPGTSTARPGARGPRRARLHRRRQPPDAGDAGRRATAVAARARRPARRGWPSAGSPRRSPACSTRRARSASLIDPNSPSIGQAVPAAAGEPQAAGPGDEPRASTATRSTPRPRRRRWSPRRRTSATWPRAATPRGWDQAGEITPIRRFAKMFAGWGLKGLDGTAWYHPQRLTIDSGAVAAGNANPAQQVLDVHATHGDDLPKRPADLRVRRGARRPARARRGAGRWRRSRGIPARNLTLVDRHATYAHNDPAGASPNRNEFLAALCPSCGRWRAARTLGGDHGGAGPGKIPVMASSNPTYEQSKQVAEASRETEWTQPSFGKELFLGNFRLDLIHPQPELDPAAVGEGRGVPRAPARVPHRARRPAADRARREDPRRRHRGPEGARRPRDEDPRGVRRARAEPGLLQQGAGAWPARGTRRSRRCCRPTSRSACPSRCASSAPRSRSASGCPSWRGPHLGVPAHRARRRLGPGAHEHDRDPDRGRHGLPDQRHEALGDQRRDRRRGRRSWPSSRSPTATGAASPPSSARATARASRSSTATSSWACAGIENSVTRFDDVFVPARTSSAGEGKGLRIALTTLNTGRLSLPAICVVGDEVLAEDRPRVVRPSGKQWGQPIGKHDPIAQKLAFLAGTAFGLEAMLDVSSRLADDKRNDIRIEAALAKLYGSELGWTAVDEMVQVRGGRAYETAESLARARREAGPGRADAARHAHQPHLRGLHGDHAPADRPRGRRPAPAGRGRRARPATPRWPTRRRPPPRPAGSTPSGSRRWRRATASKPGSFAEFGALAKHLRYVERHSRKLARSTFYAMGRYQARLEQKGHLLGRIVDIGAELYAIACACVYADTIAREQPERGSEALRTGRPVLPARPAVGPTGCSPSCGPTTTTPSTRPRSRCSPAATRGSRRTCSTRPATAR